MVPLTTARASSAWLRNGHPCVIHNIPVMLIEWATATVDAAERAAATHADRQQELQWTLVVGILVVHTRPWSAFTGICEICVICVICG